MGQFSFVQGIQTIVGAGCVDRETATRKGSVADPHNLTMPINFSITTTVCKETSKQLRSIDPVHLVTISIASSFAPSYHPNVEPFQSFRRKRGELIIFKGRS